MSLIDRHMRFITIIVLVLAAFQLEAQVFSPAIPKADSEWDWIRLDTGEWLKGELQAMYDERLEFDSEHFGIITLDMDEVAEIRTARSKTIRTSDRRTVVGQLTADEKEVKLSTEGKTEALPRDQVVSIASGQLHESSYWSAKVSIGTNLRSGNVDQMDYNARATIQRRTAGTRLYWDYTGNYSLSDGIEIASSHRTNSYFDYFFSQRFFIRPISAEYFRDPFQNISIRQTYSSSLGYSIVKRPKLTIDITGGPSWQNVNYQNVAEGEDSESSSQGGIITTTVDWEVTKWMDLIGTYRAQWARNSAGGIASHSDTTLEIEMTRNVDLTLSLIWDRIQNPIADENGVVPKRDDFKLIFGVGLDL